MQSPQDRIVKKMIDNIVERNKPEFERPAPHTTETPAQHTATPSAAPAAEDYNLISRKLEYGFNSLRQDNAELRKTVEELKGTLNMMRNDMDNLRASLRNRPAAEEPRREAPVNAPPTAMGAPQYRKTAADEEFDRKSGASEEEEKPTQARGFAKKEEPAGVDISKVFYYGKK
jgi:hypothetical protein